MDRIESDNNNQSSVNPDVFIFTMQMLTLFCVILASLINLSIDAGDQKLWLTLLTMSLGCILPTPKMSKKGSFLSSRNVSENDIKRTINI